MFGAVRRGGSTPVLSTAIHSVPQVFRGTVIELWNLSEAEGVPLQVSQRESIMGLPTDRLSSRLPRRFPVGATYVVEGQSGKEGDLRVIARYVVLPGGHRINVPADLSRPAPPRALAFRRNSNSKQSPAKGRSERGGKKFAARRGTG
jgi:hypothetical protein